MDTPTILPLQKSITTRLLATVFSFYFVITLTATVFHMSAEFYDTKNSVISDLQNLQGTFEPNIELALWSVDIPLLESTLEGMLRLPVIVGVKVEDEGGTVKAQVGQVSDLGGDRQSPAFFELIAHSFPLEADFNGEKSVVGRATMYSSTAVVFSKVRYGFLFIIVNSVIKTLALWAIFLVVGRIVLNKPLLRFTSAATKLDLDNLGKTQIDIQTKGRTELKILEEAFNGMIVKLAQAKKRLDEYTNDLENEVQARTQELQNALSELNVKHKEIKAANHQIISSLKYAQRIQNSLLADLDQVKTYLPDSFFIWRPREIVGGDIFFVDSLDDNSYYVAILDCTGHGVPGAFMTMIATSALRRAIFDEGIREPGEILKSINAIITHTLQQNTSHATSDNGLDAAICWVKPHEKVLKFSGARLPLFYCLDGKVQTIRGDRKSVGYRNADLDYLFRTQELVIENGMTFYLGSDGYSNQLGGSKNLAFGNKRFKDLILTQQGKPFVEQKEAFLEEFDQYKGENEQFDDLTTIGFQIAL